MSLAEFRNAVTGLTADLRELKTVASETGGSFGGISEGATAARDKVASLYDELQRVADANDPTGNAGNWVAMWDGSIEGADALLRKLSDLSAGLQGLHGVAGVALDGIESGMNATKGALVDMIRAIQDAEQQSRNAGGVDRPEDRERTGGFGSGSTPGGGDGPSWGRTGQPGATVTTDAAPSSIQGFARGIRRR